MLLQCIRQTIVLIAHNKGAKDDLVMDGCAAKSSLK
jgi:hypothetical protein